jgi:hypothetical protein
MNNPFKPLVSRYKQLNKKQRRNITLASSLSAILVLVGVWALTFSSSTTNSDQLAKNEDTTQVNDLKTVPAMGAVLTYKEGVVEVKNELGEWSNAPMDAEFSSGMGVRTTGAASRAIVLLDDGSVVRLDANTEVTFESLTQSKVIIAQESGYLYNRVVKAESRTYIVSSESAQYQSVGTAFRTIATGDEEAVEVYQSSIKETSTNLTAAEGEKLIIKDANEPGKNETKEKIDIERVKEDAFIKWNREQDQKDPNFKSSLGFLSDFDGPKIDISEPAVGSSIEVPADQVRGSISVKGKTEAGATLTVQSKSLSGSSPQNVTVQQDGSFETGSLEVPVGTAILEFIATDKKGNKTTQSASYTVKRKTVTQEQGIVLTIDSSAESKIKLSWGLVGIATPDGVKLVVSKDAEPTFPEDSKEYVESGSSRELKKSDYTDGTYYFRVCRYNKTTGACDIYSNSVNYTASDESDS